MFIEFANVIRRLVDECRLPVTFYQQALIATFAMFQKNMLVEIWKNSDK